MQIVVLVKQVPDMNAVKVDRATGRPTIRGQPVVSSFDAYAIEEAVKLKEEHGGEVTVISAGGPSVKDAITRALAMGADKAVQIALPDHNELDSLVVARVLADEIRKRPFDIVFGGQMSDDNQTGHVGPQVAELLGVPHVSSVTKVEVEEGSLTVYRDTEDGQQVVKTPLPVVVLALTGLNEPRYPSIKGVMAAKRKPVEQVDGTGSSRSNGISWTEPKAAERAATGTIVQDVPADEAARQLVSWLRETKLV